jgi:hypothetical protein
VILLSFSAKMTAPPAALGYNVADIPDAVWTLRTVEAAMADANMDLHVDTFMPSWKVWLYAEDIGAEHGPLTFVPGSQVREKGHRSDL